MDEAQDDAAPRRRWRLRLLLVLVLAVVAPALVSASRVAPVGGQTGAYAVFGETSDVLSVRSPAGGTSYVADFVSGARVELQFPVTNSSRWPVRIDEVFPPELALGCGWRPDRVLLEPILSPGEERPFSPVWLSRGEIVQVTLSGTFDCFGRADASAAYTRLSTVPVRYTVGGFLPRTAEVALGFTYGWTDDPALVTEDLVTRQPRARSTRSSRTRTLDRRPATRPGKRSACEEGASAPRRVAGA